MGRKKEEFIPGTTIERNIFYELNRTFTVRYTVDDNGRRKPKKERGIKTITAARTFLSDQEHKKNTGQAYEIKKLTLAQLIQDYKEEYLKYRRGNTRQNYTKQFKKTKHIENKHVSKLKKADFKSIYLDLKEEGLEISSIKQLHLALSSLFNWAVAEDYIKPWDNPVDGISFKSLFKEGKSDYEPKVYVLTRKQVAIIHQKLNTNYYYYQICIALGTGMREGEICGLKWGQVDLKQGIIHVVKGMTYVKNDEDHYKLFLGDVKTTSSHRYIEIGQDLVKLLLKLKQERLKKGFRDLDDEYVFLNNRKKPFIPSALARYCKSYIIKLFPDFTEFTFHCFRHTYATNLFDAGADVEDVSRVLGHSGPGITRMIYIHQIKERKRTIRHLLQNLYIENENTEENKEKQ